MQHAHAVDPPRTEVARRNVRCTVCMYILLWCLVSCVSVECSEVCLCVSYGEIRIMYTSHRRSTIAATADRRRRRRAQTQTRCVHTPHTATAANTAANNAILCGLPVSARLPRQCRASPSRSTACSELAHVTARLTAHSFVGVRYLRAQPTARVSLPQHDEKGVRWAGQMAYLLHECSMR